MGIFYAIIAAVFYALNTPLSKMFLTYIPPVFMASFLYIGAALGVAIIYAFCYKKESVQKRLSKRDLPYTVAMIILDVAAPISLMIGVKLSSASSVALLGNFEIVATAAIAFFIFKEGVSLKVFIAIILITASSVILTFDAGSNLKLSKGSLFVIMATIFWGFENNCTKSISNKSTYQIVILKGAFSGLISLIIALVLGERFTQYSFIIFILLLGFVAYGLSIFCYVRAQSIIGAAKTASFYALAPFIAVILSVVINKDILAPKFFIALAIMITGVIFITLDTLSAHYKI